jgi:hypothetical protein
MLIHIVFVMQKYPRILYNYPLLDPFDILCQQEANWVTECQQVKYVKVLPRKILIRSMTEITLKFI